MTVWGVGGGGGGRGGYGVRYTVRAKSRPGQETILSPGSATAIMSVGA